MFLHFVIDSFYSLSTARFLKKMHPDNRHLYIMMQHSGSSQQYSILQELRTEFLAISLPDQLLYERVSDAWLVQFDRIFIHGLFHIGLIQLLLKKVSKKTFHKLYFIPYDGEVQLAIEFLSKGNHNSINVTALQKIINWVVPPKYREIRSSFFESCDVSACNFIELSPILPQPLQPSNMDEIECFVRHRQYLHAHDPARVMIGHSCAKNENHIETLKIIAPLVEDNIEIILPMSYHVDLKYRQEVEDFGKLIFGDKFIVWKDYINPGQYQEWLKRIDAAIFNLTISSGFGVISYLAMTGAKIYTNRTQLEFGNISSFVKQGCCVFDLAELVERPTEILEQPSAQDRFQNFKIISTSQYSHRRLVENWETLLTSTTSTQIEE